MSRGDAGHAVGAGADDHRARTSTRPPRSKAPSARTPACRPSRSRRRSASNQICDEASRSARRSPRPPSAASCGPNSVDSLTGENSGNNLGPGTPVIHFEQWERDEIEVKLILKGGGCENMNSQYSLPAELRAPGPRRPHSRGRAQVHPARGVAGAGQGLRAGRDRRLHRRRSHARLRARQGAAVPHARRRESRSRGWRSSKPTIMGDGEHARRRARWASAAASSLIGCKIGALNRLPASFFVSVAYDCWAFRRLGVVLDATDRRDHAVAVSRSRRCRSMPMMDQAGLPAHRPRGRAARAARPRSRCASLKVGDVVLISGPRVHRPRRRAPSPDEARAAGGSARRRDLSLRSGGGEGRRRRGR